MIDGDIKHISESQPAGGKGICKSQSKRAVMDALEIQKKTTMEICTCSFVP